MRSSPITICGVLCCAVLCGTLVAPAGYNCDTDCRHRKDFGTTSASPNGVQYQFDDCYHCVFSGGCTPIVKIGGECIPHEEKVQYFKLTDCDILCSYNGLAVEANFTTYQSANWQGTRKVYFCSTTP